MNFPSHFFNDIVVTCVFGVIAILMLVGAYKFWDFMTPSIDEQQELKNNNMSVAVTLSVYMISVAYIIGKVISHVLGS